MKRFKGTFYFPMINERSYDEIVESLKSHSKMSLIGEEKQYFFTHDNVFLELYSGRKFSEAFLDVISGKSELPQNLVILLVQTHGAELQVKLREINSTEILEKII